MYRSWELYLGREGIGVPKKASNSLESRRRKKTHNSSPKTLTLIIAKQVLRVSLFSLSLSTALTRCVPLRTKNKSFHWRLKHGSARTSFVTIYEYDSIAVSASHNGGIATLQQRPYNERAAFLKEFFFQKTNKKITMSEGGLSFWKKMQKQPHQKQHQTQTQLPQPLASSVSPSPMETTTTTTETPQRIMVDFPGGRGPAVVVDVSERSETDEWDLLSRGSSSYHTHSNNNINNTLNNNNNSNNNNNPNHSAAIFVFKAGSVRSINTLDQDHSHNSSTNGGGGGGGGPPSFKIQRTHSNSTIDSNECNDGGLLGPSGKGVLGVDYVEHVILPTDTLQGICIAYKISMTRLRQANHFSGNSLLLAPKKLVIPISKNALKSGFIRVQDTDAKEYKLYSFLAEFPKLGMTEAKAYVCEMI